MLVENALEYANGVYAVRFELDPAVVRSQDGEPLLHLVCEIRASSGLHKALRAMLTALARQEGREKAVAGWGDGWLRSLGFEAVSSTDPEEPLSMIPLVTSPEEYVKTIYYLLRTTLTLQGDVLSHRLAKCEQCASWHLLLTRKYSMFCTLACRLKRKRNLLKYGTTKAVELMR